MILAYLLAQSPPVSSSDLFSGPITTGALFIMLTGAITYLYRARDRDRDSEIARLIQTIDRLTAELERLRDERDHHP